MTDGGEGGFDGVCRAQVYPMFGWEVVEGARSKTKCNTLTV